MQGTCVASMTCPPQQMHTYRNLPSFSSSFSLSLLPYFHVITHVIYTIASSIYEQGSEINPYRKLITHHHHHANNLSFLHTLTITILFLRPSTTLSSVFHHQSFTPPSPRGQASTSCCRYWCKQGPQLKLHARCYTESGVSFWKVSFLKTNMAQFKNFLFQKQNSCLLRQSFWLFFFLFFFLRFAKTLIQCLCFNREILWF